MTRICSNFSEWRKLSTISSINFEWDQSAALVSVLHKSPFEVAADEFSRPDLPTSDEAPLSLLLSVINYHHSLSHCFGDDSSRKATLVWLSIHLMASSGVLPEPRHIHTHDRRLIYLSLRAVVAATTICCYPWSCLMRQTSPQQISN